ncbi:MAG: glycosyltransferase family 4 protein [Bacteroidales bacterium]|nr:glycosyltransferase family 4 protein [Bacteroidales bacterium]
MPHSLKLHEALVKNGYQVSFWYYKDLTSLYPWRSLNTNLNYHVYGTKKGMLIKLIRQVLGSDLVIITGWHTKIHVLLALICFFGRIRYAYWLDVPEDPESGIKRLTKRILLKMVDYLFVTGHEGIRRISRWSKVNPAKFKDFPYLSADVDETEVAEINRSRALSLKKGGDIRVLISNRFEIRKGYQCLYDAFRELNPDCLKKLRLTIIGSGTEYEKYKMLFNRLDIAPRFEHWVEYEQYLQLIRETDVLIHPSIHEPFGIPPVDAMAHGKLTIASDGVMSVIDRIVNGKNGFIFKANDASALSDILTLICSNPLIVYDLGSMALINARKFQTDYNLATIRDLLDKR